jgi:hypothetical protein
VIQHLCKPGDIRGLGKRRACARVLYCNQCKRNIVPDAPTCGECSYCRRTQDRKAGKPYWAGKDWVPNAAV